MAPSRRGQSAGSPYFPEFLTGLTEHEKRLMAYQADARLYLITNSDSIKAAYASYIYDELCKIESILKPSTDEFSIYQVRIDAYARALIKSCILFCEDWLVLCDPENGEPSIIADAFAFTNKRFDLDAFEEQLLLEYIQGDPLDDSSGNGFGQEVGSKAARYGVGYVAGRFGGHLAQTADRLSMLSRHYDTLHPNRMRVNRSIRGGKAQKKALFEMSEKHLRYGKSAKRLGITAKTLNWLAAKAKSGALRPFSVWDVFTNCLEIRNQAPNEIDEEWVRELVLRSLSAYCKKNNNYLHLLNEYTLNQG